MKMPQLFKKDKQGKVETILKISDHFQIRLTEPGDLLDQLELFEKAAQEEPDTDVLQTVGFDTPFSETKPYLTLLAMENIFKLSKEDQTLASRNPIEAELVEYDFPISTRKNSVAEEKEIIETHKLRINLVDYQHLPHIIADTIMNVKDESISYDDRVDYLTDIFDFYDQYYGIPFKNLYGVRPIISEAVELPSEPDFSAAMNNNKIVKVVGHMYAVSKPAAQEQQNIVPDVVNNQPAPQQSNHAVNDEVSGLSFDVAPQIKTDSLPQNNKEQIDTQLPDLSFSDTPVANTPESPEEQNFEDEVSLQNQLNAADSDTPQFNIPFDASDIFVPLIETTNVLDIPEPYEAGYVEAAMQQVAAELNNSRQILEQRINSNNRAKVQELVSQLQENIYEPWQEAESDLSIKQAIEEKIDAELEERTNEQYDLRAENIKREIKAALQAEDERHQDAKQKIQEDGVLKEQRLSDDIFKENEALRPDKINDLLNEAIADRDSKINRETSQKLAEAKATVDSLIFELQFSAAETIESVLASQEEYMRQQRMNFFKQNQEALAIHAKILTAENEANSIEQVKNTRTAMENNMRELQDENSHLKQKLAETEAELRGARSIEKLNNQQTKNDQPTPVAVSYGVPFSNYQVPVAYPQNNESSNEMAKSEKNELKKSSKEPGIGRWIAGFAVAMAISIVGGAYLGHTQILAPKQSVQEQSSEVSHQSSRSKSSSSKLTLSQLDKQLEAGDLTDYDAQFKNSNLKTESRTLMVGQLLINNNRLADAQALAAANEGHNNLLNQAIKAVQ